MAGAVFLRKSMNITGTERARGQAGPGSWLRCWPMGLLCCLEGSRWLLEESLPVTRPTLLSAAAGCAMAAVIVVVWRTLRRRRGQSSELVFQQRGQGEGQRSVAAALLVTSPALGGAISDRHLNANVATIALALTPAVVAVAVTAARTNDELAGLLWPGLAGTAGLLLLLPEPSLSSWRMDVALAAMPLLSGVMSVFLTSGDSALREGGSHAAGRHNRWIERGLLLAAVLFALALLPKLHIHEEMVFSWAASAVDGMVSLLTLWTLQRVGAVRWSAQFLLTPFVTIAEGVALLRPALTARSWVGLFLLMLGGVYLLVPRSES